MIKIRFSILLILALLLTMTVFADEEAEIDSFPAATTITGVVTEINLDLGYISIDGVAYWFSEDVDLSTFIVGEAITFTVVMSDDVTMTIIEAEPYTGEVEEIDPNDNHPVGTALAEGLGVTYEDIMGWADAEIGFGEIARAYLLANEAGVPVEEIFAMRLDTHAGWGQIMKQYGVSPSLLAPGRLISGKLVIAGVDLPDDVDADGTLDSEFSPEVTGIDFDAIVSDENSDDTVASNQGNDGVNKFGCEGRGNSCNAPGHNKDTSEDVATDNSGE